MFIFLFRAAMIVIAVILIIAGCFDQYGESRKSKKAALLGIIPLAVFLLSMCIVYVPSNNVGIRWSTVAGAPAKSLDGYREVAVEYVNMINKVITPMNPFTAPIAAAALGVMKEIVMKELNSEAKSAVKSIEILLKVSTRSEKVPYHK